MLKMLVLVAGLFTAIQGTPWGMTKTTNVHVYNEETNQYELTEVKEEEIPGIFSEVSNVYYKVTVGEMGPCIELPLND